DVGLGLALPERGVDGLVVGADAVARLEDVVLELVERLLGQPLLLGIGRRVLGRGRPLGGRRRRGVGRRRGGGRGRVLRRRRLVLGLGRCRILAARRLGVEARRDRRRIAALYGRGDLGRVAGARGVVVAGRSRPIGLRRDERHVRVRKRGRE